MSDNAAFHIALCNLAHANAANTLEYILSEARAINERACQDMALWLCPHDCQAILDIMTDPGAGIVVAACDGTVLWANETLAGWMGHTPATMLGKSLWDLSPQADAEKRRRDFAKAMVLGRPMPGVNRNSQDQAVQTCVVPFPAHETPCGIVLARPVPQARVFKELYSDEARLIE